MTLSSGLSGASFGALIGIHEEKVKIPRILNLFFMLIFPFFSGVLIFAVFEPYTRGYWHSQPPSFLVWSIAGGFWSTSTGFMGIVIPKVIWSIYTDSDE
jgi:hypothetical protein